MKEKSEPRVARSHTARARHTALLVKALNAGQTMPGVICRKQTKKKKKFSCLCFFKRTYRGGDTFNVVWEGNLFYCGRHSFGKTLRLLGRDLHRTHFLQPSSQVMQSS